MADDRTDIAKLAAAILAGARYNEHDILRLAGSVMGHLPDHREPVTPSVMEQARGLFGNGEPEPEPEADRSFGEVIENEDADGG